MKVLHVSGARSWGGNEQQLLYLVEELNSYGVQQFLFCYEGTPLFDRIKEYDIEVIAIPYVKPYKKRYRSALKKATEQYGFNLIHLHTSDSVTGYVVSDLLTKLNTKTVFSKKGISRSISVLSKYKYNYKNINKILCVSQVVFDHFTEVLYPKNREKLCMVYDGVKVLDNENSIEKTNLKKELNISSDTKVIGNIANHNTAKDLKTLIRTLDDLVNKRKLRNVHLIQVGEFTKRTQELKDLVSEFNLEEYISFVGFKKNASSILSEFDVYLMTSEREGGPTTVLEAFYKKVPVVSTKVGIVGEAIEDGKNGFFTPVGDYKSLADKLEVLLNDDAKKSSFAKLSYDKFINNYTAKKLGENTFAVYNKILEIDS